MEDYSIYTNGAEVHIQDQGRTLKVLPTRESDLADLEPIGDYLALKVGGLLGTLMRLGVDARPVFDDQGNYVNKIIVDLGSPFGEVAVIVLPEDFS